MGLKRELVKSVFSRSRSGAHDGANVRRVAAEKRRWSSVRSYLCGEELEFDSVVAEEDSASVKSSEATVTQSVTDDLNTGEASKSVGIMEDEIVSPQPEENSVSKLFDKEDAAVIIQSAFRRYLARRPSEAGTMTSLEEDDELTTGTGSPSKAESISTSIEVQTSHSMEVLSVRDETLPVMSNPTQHKTRIVQALKPKEDWDDSTVSSNISRMRIQHKLEAMTRRERALAYAFSQQLRICSKKRQMKTLEGAESDMGWSWLERWMATRESSIVADHGNQKLMVRKRLLDLAREEKESCGSNEVSVHLDSVWMAEAEDRDNAIASTNRIKTTPKRKPLPRKQCRKVYAKVSKKEPGKEMEVGLDKHKQKRMEQNSENNPDDRESQEVLQEECL